MSVQATRSTSWQIGALLYFMRLSAFCRTGRFDLGEVANRYGVFPVETKFGNKRINRFNRSFNLHVTPLPKSGDLVIKLYADMPKCWMLELVVVTALPVGIRFHDGLPAREML